MILLDEQHVLMIEPQGPALARPVVDALTRKMTAALRQCTTQRPTRGVHQCRCGVQSSNVEHILPDGRQTNSLCVHYLAYHRPDVPASELAKVEALDLGEAEPKADELRAPGYTRPRKAVYRG